MSDLDDLMSRDPLLLSAQDIDKIIEVQRKSKANFEAGVKPAKGESKPIDLQAMGLIKPAAVITRRL